MASKIDPRLQALITLFIDAEKYLRDTYPNHAAEVDVGRDEGAGEDVRLTFERRSGQTPCLYIKVVQVVDVDDDRDIDSKSDEYIRIRSCSRRHLIDAAPRLPDLARALTAQAARPDPIDKAIETVREFLENAD
jgi:hypothetical protein